MIGVACDGCGRRGYAREAGDQPPCTPFVPPFTQAYNGTKRTPADLARPAQLFFHRMGAAVITASRLLARAARAAHANMIKTFRQVCAARACSAVRVH
ncbi:hypothetical protein EON68_02600 [archaeon]|nr:MAG: hypothetical protein EON68_02600 [archaeon]